MPIVDEMYNETQVHGVVRIDPVLFSEKLEVAVNKQLREDYEGKVFPQLGRVVSVLTVDEVGEGTLIPGDGAAYYQVIFKVLNYIPEVNELVDGEIKDIASFGVFVDFGPFEGLIHVSQAMDDFVSFSKQGTLTGKESGKVLKMGDQVRARIVAVSFKDMVNPKIGLTMRQPYLGKHEWITEERTKAKKATTGATKETKAAPKAKK